MQMPLVLSRTLLFVALVPTGLLSLLFLAHGLGIDNWRWDRPFYVAIIPAIAAMPIWVIYALRLSFNETAKKRIALHVISIWAVIVFYALFVLGALPAPIYQAWQSLVG